MASRVGTWCDQCSRLVAPEKVVHAEDGSEVCPHCNAELGVRAEEPREEAPPRAPWHFKVLLVGTIGYLIYRAIWFGFWISHHA